MPKLQPTSRPSATHQTLKTPTAHPSTRMQIPHDQQPDIIYGSEGEDEEEEEDLFSEVRDLQRMRDKVMARAAKVAAASATAAYESPRRYVPPRAGMYSIGYDDNNNNHESKTGGDGRSGNNKSRRRVYEVPSDEGKDNVEVGRGAVRSNQHSKEDQLNNHMAEGDSGEMGDTELEHPVERDEYEDDEEDDDVMGFDDANGHGDGVNERDRVRSRGSVGTTRAERISGLTADVARSGRLSALEQLKLNRRNRGHSKALASRSRSPARSHVAGTRITSSTVSKLAPRPSHISSTTSNNVSRTERGPDPFDTPNGEMGATEARLESPDDGMFDDDAMMEEAVAIAERAEAYRSQESNDAAHQPGRNHTVKQFGSGSIEEDGEESVPIPWSMTPPRSDEHEKALGRGGKAMNGKAKVNDGMSWEPTSTAQKRKELEEMFDEDDDDEPVAGQANASGSGSARQEDTFFSAAEDSFGRSRLSEGNRTSGGSRTAQDRTAAIEARPTTKGRSAVVQSLPDLIDLEDDDDCFMEPMGTQDVGNYDDVNLAQGIDDVIELDEDDDYDDDWYNAQEYDAYGSGDANSNPGGPSMRSPPSFAVPALPSRFEAYTGGPMIHPIKTIDSLSPELQDFFLHHWCRGAANGRGEDGLSGATRQEEQARVKDKEATAGRGRGRGGGGARGGRGRAPWRGGRGGFRGRGRGKR